MPHFGHAVAEAIVDVVVVNVVVAIAIVIVDVVVAVVVVSIVAVTSSRNCCRRRARIFLRVWLHFTRVVWHVYVFAFQQGWIAFHKVLDAVFRECNFLWVGCILQPLHSECGEG